VPRVLRATDVEWWPHSRLVRPLVRSLSGASTAPWSLLDGASRQSWLLTTTFLIACRSMARSWRVRRGGLMTMLQSCAPGISVAQHRQRRWRLAHGSSGSNRTAAASAESCVMICGANTVEMYVADALVPRRGGGAGCARSSPARRWQGTHAPGTRLIAAPAVNQHQFRSRDRISSRGLLG